ncbi:unnamed protein product [Vitrella brassicaformis CCMP3155]|uniref:Protein kinase domain-containing protein n=2 Tax=Vitrella brassicaformis TaxID=1169539 RepID=A0A0G4G4Q1_VITBC|nr:unnamed protein product [Vitrella brassicaformis CCMP3155]|eukprot:CEM23387.1 unnamed protein product [Vitrella brassicaformis CCMP3155]
MTRHSWLLYHLLIGLSLAPIALPQPSSGPLRVGLICPLSGSLSEEGQDFDDGFRYWYDTVSEAGGVRVGGAEELTPVELVELDSESNGTKAVSNARAMVDRQVDVVVQCAALDVAGVAEVLEASSIVNLHCSGPFFPTDLQYSFGIQLPAQDYYAGLLRDAHLQRISKIALVVDTTDPTAEAICDGARDHASSFNLNISSELSLDGATTTDNKTVSQIAEFLRNAADNDEVQAVFACVSPEGGEAFTEAVIEAKQDFQIVAVSSLPMTAEFLERFGRDLAYLLTPAQWHPTLVFNSDPPSLFGSSEEFSEGFAAKHGRQPNENVASCAAAGLALQLALESMGPDEWTDDRETNSGALREALGSLEKFEEADNTFFGRLDLSGQQNTGREPAVLQWLEEYEGFGAVLPLWVRPAGCPSGTRQLSGRCEPCPEGQTSRGPNATECSAAALGGGDSSTTIIIVAVVVVVVAVLLSLLLLIILWKCGRLPCKPKHTWGSGQGATPPHALHPEDSMATNGKDKVVDEKERVKRGLALLKSRMNGGKGMENGMLHGQHMGSWQPSTAEPTPRKEGTTEGESGDIESGNGKGLLGGETSTESSSGMAQRKQSFPVDFTEILPTDLVCGWKEEETIGSGATCSVFRGTWHGTKVAIKKFPTQLIEGGNLRKVFVSEVSALEALRHPNIITYFGCHPRAPYLIVMQYANGGSLYHLLHKQKKDEDLSWTEKMRILVGIAGALQYLHKEGPGTKKGTVHGDLKSANVLLNYEDGQRGVKLSDFGFSRVKAQQTQQVLSLVGWTVRWAPPEMMERLKRREKGRWATIQTLKRADVYSFGVLMYEVAARRVPYPDLDETKIAPFVLMGGRPTTPTYPPVQGAMPRVAGQFGDVKNRPSFAWQLPPGCPKALEAIMQESWADDPETRPTFDQITPRLQALYGSVSEAESRPGGLEELNAREAQLRTNPPQSTGMNVRVPTITTKMMREVLSQAPYPQGPDSMPASRMRITPAPPVPPTIEEENSENYSASNYSSMRREWTAAHEGASGGGGGGASQASEPGATGYHTAVPTYSSEEGGAVSPSADGGPKPSPTPIARPSSDHSVAMKQPSKERAQSADSGASPVSQGQAEALRKASGDLPERRASGDTEMTEPRGLSQFAVLSNIPQSRPGSVMTDGSIPASGRSPTSQDVASIWQEAAVASQRHTQELVTSVGDLPKKGYLKLPTDRLVPATRTEPPTEPDMHQRLQQLHGAGVDSSMASSINASFAINLTASNFNPDANTNGSANAPGPFGRPS